MIWIDIQKMDIPGEVRRMIKMTDRQRSCIRWICNVLKMDYPYSDSRFDAWRFIDRYKPIAEAKVKEWNERKRSKEHLDVDRAILGIMSDVGLPMYSCVFDRRKGGLWQKDDWDARSLSDDDIDSICPGGINCKDDIQSYGWMFAMNDNIYL